METTCKCGNVVKENDAFCSKCGEPLTELSREFAKNQCRNEQLKIVLKLIDEVKDAKTLLLLKQYVEKLSK